ncbi:MAG TPA: hypothetical protein VJU78_13530 [Chitinophagaceae bacterium]|nr:hypothetical protein [Chitinophagaceae bacterium]
MKLKIFYSWQTETDTTYNRNFILTNIEKAVKNLNRKPEFKTVEFIIQEGVKGEPGSPGVASKINDERIPNCDIFIADLSVVNQIGRIAKWIQKHFDKKEFRPSQNNNVINEYGIATNAIGVQKIIGVLNNTYGSPNENPNNIPFDLRHLRFPVGYSFSSKTKNKEKAQKELLDGLTTAIRDTAIFAIQHQKSKHSPLIVWSDWELTIPITEKFIPNAKADEIKKAVLQILSDSKLSIRILGLSGLGKTRILLEIFRPINTDNNSILISSRVLYINCNDNPNADFQALFTKLNLEQEGRIVILDNCSIEIHRQALGFAKRENNRTSFISLDSNPEEINHNKITGVNYVVIEKEDLSSVVDEILNRDFGGIGDENIKTIKEFSQGIPLMAVLLAESVKNGEKFIGKLEDKLLLDKLLGPKGQEYRNRAILKACSIFNYFGFTDELTSQTEFIAKNKHITSLNGDDIVILNEFNEVCDHYLKRGIFERRGRFIGMRPFPLAMSLAQEWLEPCTPARLIDVIISIANLPEPNRRNLSEALSEQMKYLGYNDKAVEIVDRIIGPGSPFDNAEVLNTELGSRLFRSFVEVNPIAVSQNFKRAFSQKTTAELLNIHEGRRNLVWVLEKLCFDKRVFKDSVKLLFSFAIAENETWANNATGQFLHLFNIHLSGTEAKLSDRWEIIEWGLNREDEMYYEFAIKAMNVGLNYGHFSRMGGAEQQGSKRLYDNQPTWQEIKEYWTNILNKLLEVIKSRNKYADSASDTIANKIRTFFHIQMGDLIIPFVKEISRFKNHDWDSGLKGLKFARKYEKHLLSEKLLTETNGLIESLTKTDFATRYLTLSNSYHLDNDEPHSSEKIKATIVTLADEFIAADISWDDTFPIFYKTQQTYSYFFGKRLFELLKDDKVKINYFIDLSLKVISKIAVEERNVTVLGGFIAESNDELKNEFYSKIVLSTEYCCLLFYFLSIDPSGKKYFDLLFQLIENDKCKLSNFYTFTYSNALSQLSLEELNNFSDNLFKYQDEGYEIVFDLLFDLGYGDENKKLSLLPIYKKCIYKLGVNRNLNRQLDDYKWSETIILIISNETEIDFAQFINKSVISSISWENSYHLDHYIQKIYEVLMQVHFNSIWPDLSEALLSKEESYMTFYGLKHILGSHIGGAGRTVGVLFSGNIDEIFKWCEENKPLAPSRFAELTPIFNNNNTDYSEWHPVALRLLDQFGDIKEVLSNLSANMGTYSWTGSVVPFLESKKELFNQIIDHPRQEVRNWAESYITFLDKDIEAEKNRDAESFL